METSREHPAVEGTERVKLPSTSEVANFLIFPSAFRKMTEAPVMGSPEADSTTRPDTLTCAIAGSVAKIIRHARISCFIKEN